MGGGAAVEPESAEGEEDSVVGEEVERRQEGGGGVGAEGWEVAAHEPCGDGGERDEPEEGQGRIERGSGFLAPADAVGDSGPDGEAGEHPAEEPEEPEVMEERVVAEELGEGGEG